MNEILQAFLLIFIAEMGDKTQILAMAFATKYPVKKVLAGIGIGAFLNHGIAVMIGSYIGTNFDLGKIQIVAGAAFILFSLWTLKDEGEETEVVEGQQKYGAIVTVALAFFIGELGDKTQLTAITLATTATYPALILVGTVAGMLATGGLGIFVGKKLGDRVPEFTIKIVSSGIFFIFGSIKLYENLPPQYLSAASIIFYLTVFLLISAVLLRPQVKRRRAGVQSSYVKMSKRLHDYYKHLDSDFDDLCINCEKCEGKKCVIGYGKDMVEQILNDPEGISIEGENLVDIEALSVPVVSKEKISKHLDELDDFIEANSETLSKDKKTLEQFKKQLEAIYNKSK